MKANIFPAIFSVCCLGVLPALSLVVPTDDLPPLVSTISDEAQTAQDALTSRLTDAERLSLLQSRPDSVGAAFYGVPLQVVEEEEDADDDMRKFAAANKFYESVFSEEALYNEDGTYSEYVMDVLQKSQGDKLQDEMENLFNWDGEDLDKDSEDSNEFELDFIDDIVNIPWGTAQEDSKPDPDPLPVVMWHGLGDSATAQGMQDVADLIQKVHPGTYVHIISATPNPDGDRQASWFGNVSQQLEVVCSALAADRILSTAPAVHAVGFSQGGQFLRAYQQRCAGVDKAPKIHNLITFGSQHNGIAEFQRCSGPTDFVCHGAQSLLRGNVWTDFVQTRVVPAQYYRGDYTNEDQYEQYLEHSALLADINNERQTKNPIYAKRLAELNTFVMVVFRDDKTVIPKESGWFADVDPESGNVTSLRQRKMYTEDWLGLKKLDEKDGLVFESVPGEHMRLTDKDLKRLFGLYLGPA